MTEVCAEGPATYHGVPMLVQLTMTALAAALPPAGACTPGRPAAPAGGASLLGLGAPLPCRYAPGNDPGGAALDA